jgi:hypothetical protein
MTKKSPLEGHPRAEETRQAMLQARFDDEQEVVDLQASELACDVADAWTTYKYHSVGFQESQRFTEAMERLELVTRASGMRKVVP